MMLRSLPCSFERAHREADLLDYTRVPGICREENHSYGKVKVARRSTHIYGSLDIESLARTRSIALYISCESAPCPSEISSRHSTRVCRCAANLAGVRPIQQARSSRIFWSACSKVSSTSFQSESGTGTICSGQAGSACG